MGETKQLLSPLTRSQDVMRKVIDMMGKARMNKRSKIILRKTLKNMTHVVQEIKQYNEHLDQPREEIVILIKEKDAGEELMCSSCSRSIWWTIFLSWLPLYGDGLWHNRSDSFDADKQVKDIKNILYEVRVVVELLEMESFEQKLKGVGAPIKCPFGVPENPEFTVGLDLLLSKLKIEVLRDGMSTLLLTGLGGSGKTTLATKLCRDEEIKGKFKENILFFTFSQTPKLKNVIERLFEHCGYHVPEFISDEDAIKRLGILLRKIEGSPLLLVLDDVWPGSEALIEKFKFQMSDYKILVTSRVTFPKIGTPFVLKQLAHEDAMTLFRHHALLKKSSSSVPDEELVQKVVRYCKGLPLAIKVIGKSLSHRPIELWQKMVEELSQGHSILDSNIELLTCFQKLLHVLEDNPNIKECFMDLGLFPEDQRIPVPVLTDIWAVLYKFDDDGIEAMDIINRLESMNLVNVIVARKNSSVTDNYYYNNRFVILHDLLRELAIYQNNQEPIEKRKRLITDINENKREWWIREKQQGMISRVLTKFRSCSVKQTLQPVPACTLSISADETNTSYQSHIQPSQAGVLVLNLQTKKYSFPELIEKMSELKVLIMTNYGIHPCELENFKLLSSVSNLRRIRLERISVPHLGALKNLEKLSLYMCGNISRAFENGTIPISDSFPNLSDLNIDYCKDMVELPTGICDIAPLKKLSITNCHNLGSLPQGIGKLLNLELLNLSSCTDLEELPDSIVNLSKLSLLDLSNCISLSSLPEDIGNLCNLRNLNMTSCARCELPYSVTNFENLKVVVCDEETAASWETFEDMLPNMKLEVPRVEVNLNWLHSVSS